jgi:hypothetical protein
LLTRLTSLPLLTRHIGFAAFLLAHSPLLLLAALLFLFPALVVRTIALLALLLAALLPHSALFPFSIHLSSPFPDCTKYGAGN